jgi:predicted RNA methylase
MNDDHNDSRFASGLSWPHPSTFSCSPAEFAAGLRFGMCPSDRAFDQYFPEEIRAESGRFWTPVDVARSAARWIEGAGARTVLDIGAGAGKFALVAAMASSSLRVVGLEHRPRLVEVAHRLAGVFSLRDRVSFLQGTFDATPTPHADAYYLFNPFGENLFGDTQHLDGSVELSVPRFRRDTAAVTRLLRDSAIGTLVCTYNGFGGSIPQGYTLKKIDATFSCPLRLWQKVTHSPPRGGQWEDD